MTVRPGAGEVRVERRRVLIDLVAVASRRIRLPDLDQRLRHRASIVVEDPSLDDDALAKGLAGVLPGEVGVGMSIRR